MASLNDLSLFEAATWYQTAGLYIHPLRSHDKKPISKKWSEINQHYTEAELKRLFAIKDPKNIGLVCGEISNCTIIDRDHIVKGIWQGLNSSQWIKQQRTGNRDHLFFKYCDGLQAKKYHALGFEILNNGSNCVLTPSIHPSGDKYQFTHGDPQDRPQINQDLIERIKGTITAYEALQRTVNNCRPVFRHFFKAFFQDNEKANPHFRDMSVFHGSTGRELTLYLFAELKANGATFEEMDLLCKLIFLDDYDKANSEYQIGKIDQSRTATTDTIKGHSILSQFYDHEPDTCKQGKQGKQATEATEEEPVRDEVPEHIKARAREIAEQGNPLEYIIGVHQTLHVGDIGIAQSLLLSATCQHVMNTDGIQPKLSGASGKGKSDCAKGMAHLIPQEWVITSSLSDKAIYYMGDELRPGTILFCDDVALSEEMEKVINRATTFYQTGATHTTVDTNRKRLTLRIPARLGWWLTSIDDDQSLQTLNRTFGGEVDESKEQDRHVKERQLDKALTGEVGLPLSDEVLTCREIIRDIKEQLYRVKIPFAKAIIWNDESNRRNLPMFLDLIKAFAVLRHRQRDIDGEGCLIASYQDFIDAKLLYESRAEAQTTKLTAQERELCEALSKAGSMTAKALCAKLGVSKSRLSQILHGKGKNHDSGAFYKVKELWEEDVSVKIGDNYVRQKMYGYNGKFNSLGGFDSIIGYDSLVYPVYPEFTPSLPCKNDSGRIVFTLFTLFTEEKSKINSTNSHDLQSEEEKDKNTLSSSKPENEGKQVNTRQQMPFLQGKLGVNTEVNTEVNEATDSEQQKGKHPTEKGKQQSEGTFYPMVNTAKVHKWLSEWEMVHNTKLNSQNYQEAALEYAKKFTADLQEIEYITCKYAGIEEVCK